MKTHNFLKIQLTFYFPSFTKAAFLKVRNQIEIEVSQIPRNDDRFLNGRGLTLSQNVSNFFETKGVAYDMSRIVSIWLL
jgi:hypothetical protein